MTAKLKALRKIFAATVGDVVPAPTSENDQNREMSPPANVDNMACMCAGADALTVLAAELDTEMAHASAEAAHLVAARAAKGMQDADMERVHLAAAQKERDLMVKVRPAPSGEDTTKFTALLIAFRENLGLGHGPGSGQYGKRPGISKETKTAHTEQAAKQAEAVKSAPEQPVVGSKVPARTEEGIERPHTGAVHATGALNDKEKERAVVLAGLPLAELKRQTLDYGKGKAGFAAYVPKAARPEKATEQWDKLNKQVGALEGRANAMIQSKARVFVDNPSQRMLYALAIHLREKASRVAEEREKYLGQ